MASGRVVGRAAAALVGMAGIAWVVQAVVSGDAADGPTYVVGLVLLLLGLAAFGYALVTTAPLWLRVVVAVATPALGCVVWLSVWDGVSEARITLLLLAGLVLMAAAVLGVAAHERRAAADSGRATGGQPIG